MASITQRRAISIVAASALAANTAGACRRAARRTRGMSSNRHRRFLLRPSLAGRPTPMCPDTDPRRRLQRTSRSPARMKGLLQPAPARRWVDVSIEPLLSCVTLRCPHSFAGHSSGGLRTAEVANVFRKVGDDRVIRTIARCTITAVAACACRLRGK